MNANLVTEAIETMNRRYLPGILKCLDKQDACGTVTITMNRSELAILLTLVSGRIGELHDDWYNATHDETETSVQDLAYELYQIESHDRQVSKLYNKLSNASK